MEPNLICNPGDNRQFIQLLLTYFEIAQDATESFIPSEYSSVMRLSPEQRLERLLKTRRNRILAQPSPFLATPDVVIFQNFTPGKSYSATLTLQNKEESLRCVRVFFEASPQFSISHPPSVIWTKVAPGMSYQIIITFNASELKDYKHQIAFFTEREHFQIPLYAFRPRPLVDFPNHIDMPETPVKTISTKNVVVKNCGIIPASFTIGAKPPLGVCPAQAILAPNEIIYIKIFYKSETLGRHSGELLVKFDDDIQLKVTVEYNATNAMIFLQKDTFRFEDTYIGLQRNDVLKLENRSDHVAKFKWKMYKSSNIERMRTGQLKEALDSCRETETLRSTKITRMNIIDEGAHAMVYRRIYEDEIEEVEECEDYLFHKSNFSIRPLCGEIGPNASIDFNMIFSPLRCETVESWAYLEITGRQERLPLKLYGTGLGPSFKFNVKELNANTIFLCSEHQYELIVANVGHIPGAVGYVEKPTEFGVKIKCTPEVVFVNPGHYAALVLSFSTTQEGKFIEKIEFTVSDSNEVIHFVMRGTVIAPLLSLDITEIDFGVVCLGYELSKTITIHNKTQVPISYYIEICGDGGEPAIDCETFLSGYPFPFHPKEFDFDPNEGTVEEYSSITGTLTLLPNIVREQTLQFKICMWGSNSHSVSIPIKYDCRVADIQCLPPKVNIKFCFINYMYDRRIILRNLSNMPGHLKHISYEQSSESYLMVDVDCEENIYIPPLGEIELTLQIQTPALGLQEVPLTFEIFGKAPEVLCQIVCDGQGPSVGIVPPSLNFGEVKLLETVTRDIELINDTPIVAEVKFTLPKSPFSLTFTELVIGPSSKQWFPISVYLKDPGKQTQVLQAKIKDGQQNTIQLSAFGVGTSLNCFPKLEPIFDMGTLLTYKKSVFNVTLLNEGSRWHKVFFSNSESLRILKEVAAPTDIDSCFKMVPNYFYLMTDQSGELEISAVSESIGEVEENYYGHAIVEKVNKKSIILSFVIKAKFVDPSVSLSKKEVTFRMDVSPESVFTSLEDVISVTNLSGTTLEIDFVLKPPFYMVTEGKRHGHIYVVLKNLSRYKIYIQFKPPPHKRRCIVFEDNLYINYRHHPKVDLLYVKGEINYPTLSIEPHKVNFECVPIGSSSSRTILLKNISPLPVIYKWLWVASSFIREEIQPSTIVLPHYEFPEWTRPLSFEEQVEELIQEINIAPVSDIKTRTSLTPKVSVYQPESSTVELNSIMESSGDGDYQECSIEDRMKNILHGLIPKEDSENDYDFTELLSEVQENPIEKIFSLIPHEGCLEPGESVVTHFRFDPEPNYQYNTTAICHIMGGEDERVPVVGTSSVISFELEATTVDFGNLYFFEQGQQKLILMNNGHGKFAFTVSEANMSPGWLKVEPQQGYVDIGEDIALTLQCLPGSVGRFETKFFIQLGYLEPIELLAQGCGVFPQIYFIAPRPDIAKMDPMITYSAIADLATYPFSKDDSSDVFSELDASLLEADGWIIVTSDELMPSIIDIELSTERVFAYYQLCKTASLLQRMIAGEKIWPFPNLVVTPYFMDLGCVPINSRNIYKIKYINYGPFKTSVKSSISDTFRSRGFDLKFIHHTMEWNQHCVVNLTFVPSVERYPELNTSVCDYCFFDVKNGARIPIQVKALVATPTLQVSQTTLDFNAVRCGDCLRKSIKFINDGFLVSAWHAVVEEHSKVRAKAKPSFFVINDEGILEPGESFFLRVYFEPKSDDMLSAQLKITIDGNYRETIIELQGQGMESILEISQDCIIFEPNIPYSCNNFKYVTIRNASKFPVEFFFPDFDQLVVWFIYWQNFWRRQIFQEEALVRYYALYNRTNRVYYPYREPGGKLPSIFQEYYDKLLLEMEVKRAEPIKSTDRQSMNMATYIKGRSQILQDIRNILNVNLSGKTFEERDEFVTGYLTKLSKYIKLSGASSMVLVDTEKQYKETRKDGILLIFHGAPYTNYVKMAHETGKVLDMPVYSIDRLVIECLLNEDLETARALNQIIDAAFEEVANDEELEILAGEDRFDVIKRKVSVLLEGRPKRPKQKKDDSKKSSGKGGKKSGKSSKKSSKGSGKSNKKSDKKSSKKSSKKGSKSSKKSKSSKSSKGSKKKKISDTLINIPQHYFCDLLEEHFRSYPPRMILEGLESNFIRKVPIVLDCLLKSSRNVHVVHFVIFSCTFDEYQTLEDARLSEEQAALEKSRADIYASMDDMDAEEFNRVRLEFRDLFTTYISKRKLEIKMRRELAKERRSRPRSIRRIQSLASKTKPVEAKMVETKKKKGSSKSSDKKKKKDKDQKKSESKSSKSSNKSKKNSSKKSKSSGSKKSSRSKSKEKKKRKLTKEQAEIKSTFDNFENSLSEMLHVLEFWDKKNCILTRAYTKAGAKSKTKKDKGMKTPSASSLKTSASTEKNVKKMHSKINTEDIGIPCWVLNRVLNCASINLTQLIPQYANSTVEYQQHVEKATENEYIEPDLLQSVMQRPKQNRPIRKSSVFVISNLVEKVDVLGIPNDEETKIGSRISLSSKRKKSSLKRSIMNAEVAFTKSHAEFFNPRQILQPGELIKFKISFLPTSCGDYRHNFDLELVGWPTKYSIFCKAISDIPRICMDPNFLFVRVLENRTEKNKYEQPVYLENQEMFDFGGILLPDPKGETTYETTSKLYLNNVSYIPCETSFALKNNSEIFKYLPVDYLIQPTERKELVMVACPQLVEKYEDSLIISIKNNPKIERVNLSCYGCARAVDVNPKLIFFERVILGNSIMKEMTLTNSTPVEMTWNFVNHLEVLKYFGFSMTRGQLCPYGLQSICVEFTARRPDSISVKKFGIEMFDPLERLVQTMEVAVEAETTVLQFDYNNHVDFGEVKGKVQHQQHFTITNKSNHDYIMEISEIFENNKMRDKQRACFKIQPIEAKLHPNGLSTSTITFMPTTTMHLETLPVFGVTLTDPFYKTIIGKFDIKISSQVFLSKCEICPYPEVYFGYQSVGTDKILTIQILNKGRFDFNYVIKDTRVKPKSEKKSKGSKKSSKKSDKKKGSSKSSKSKKSNKSKADKKSKDSKKSKNSAKSKSSKSKSKNSKISKLSKSAKSSKSSKKKIKLTTLKAGIFSLTSSTGSVEPAEKVVVQIKSSPKQEGVFEEIVVVETSESSLEDSKGKRIRIHVIACEPKVNFNDLNSIFKEQLIVNTLNDLIVSDNIQTHAIFGKVEKKLLFSKVCVNTTETTKIRIQNIGHVPAQIQAKLLNGNNIFTISPNSFMIDPYQTGHVMIIYTPDSLESHQTTLTLTCNGALSSDELVINVSGEACVPAISILEPEPDPEIDFYLIGLRPIFLGAFKNRNITFKNIGPIPCKVILEIVNDTLDQLSLIPKEETIPFLNIWDPDVAPMKHTNLVNLACGETAKFLLRFEPREQCCVDARVKIHIVNNPFEIKTGYYLDVSLNGLRPYSRSTSVMSVTSNPVFGYSLEFGYSCLNTLEKKCFFIQNNSKDAIYKFELPNFTEIIFTPSVGHLRPGASKQIIASFLSKTPVDLRETKIECKIYKIQYLKEQESEFSWDERQHFVVWKDRDFERDSNKDFDAKSGVSVFSVISLDEASPVKSKRIEENPEPEISIVENSWQNLIIFITIAASYSSYKCEIEELTIPDTFLMSKETVNFHIENTGKIPLKIQWAFTINELLPRRINSSRSIGSTATDKLPSVKASEKQRKSTPLAGDEKFLFGATGLSRSASMSTLFSTEAEISNRSGDSWSESYALPFSIEPNHITIEPKRRENFKVTFTPNDVYDYLVHLRSIIPNKAPELSDLDIVIKARSILPLYCFDLEPSNYLTEKRKGRKLCNDLVDENTKVVEFESVGLGIICTRKFHLRNPTKDSFYFTWKPARETDLHLSCYHCHTRNGLVAKGKTAEIIFSFVPKDFGIFEEFYIFEIPNNDIKVTFLLAGLAREPRVQFDRVHLEFPPAILGTKVTEEVNLINEEEESYNFKFKKSSFVSAELNIEPLAGYLKSGEVLPIKIFFNSIRQGVLHYDLRCLVEKTKGPLSLSITTSCFEITPLVFYNEKDGSRVEISSKKNTIIKLGGVIPMEKSEIDFSIVNVGQIGFQWMWSMNSAKIAGVFEINFDKTQDCLLPNESSASKMTIQPLIKSTLENFKIYLKIPHGPLYTIQLNCSSDKPPYKFSFTEYDFGKCLVQKGPSKYYRTTLQITNSNIWPITVEKGDHENHVSSNFHSAEIPPRTRHSIIIYFHPLNAGDYKLHFPLFVNGAKHDVTILGKGVALNMTFVHENEKFINLGSVLVGRSITKMVKVRNKTECTINTIFDFWERLPMRSIKEVPANTIEIPKEEPAPAKVGKKDKKKKPSKGGSKKGKNTKKSKAGSRASGKSAKKGKKASSKKSSKSGKKSGTSKGSKSGKKNKKKKEKPKKEEVVAVVEESKKNIDYLTITPNKFTNVHSNKIMEFAIKFSPKERMETFVEKIFYQTQNHVEAFCLVKGKALSPEFSLDRTHLTFGNVVVGYETKMHVMLRNTGDIGIKFKWLLDRKEENFKIIPSKGLVVAGSNLIFDVIFKPKSIHCLIRTKIDCLIENLHKTVTLMLSGSGIHFPPAKATIVFSCPVRETEIKTIQISNPTGLPWEITPEILSGAPFNVPTVIRVAGKSDELCQIVYSPMKLEDIEALLSLPLPDGQVVSYSLKGVTLPPLPAGSINREISCKTDHVEELTVKNWLQMHQQFSVSTSVIGTVSSKDLFTISGNELVEVPPNFARIYKWIIHPITEGQLNLKVTFTNKTTKEYLFYEISLKVLPNKKLDLITFETCARETLTKIIKLENPVNVPICFSMTCSQNEGLTFEKEAILEPFSVYNLEIVYNPLKREQSTRTFEAVCKELGTFTHNLVLIAHPPVPEPAVFFKTFLGQTVHQKVDVVTTSAATFDFEDAIFSMDKILQDQSQIMIAFEPNNLGRFQSRFTLRSQDLGEFIYPLIGESCLPKPQGPFLLKTTSPANINFKNPFLTEMMFHFRTEPVSLYTKCPYELIGPKKSTRIIVFLDAPEDPNDTRLPISGKLTVTGDQSDIKWIFYLKEDKK